MFSGGRERVHWQRMGSKVNIFSDFPSKIFVRHSFKKFARSLLHLYYNKQTKHIQRSFQNVYKDLQRFIVLKI